MFELEHAKILLFDERDFKKPSKSRDLSTLKDEALSKMIFAEIV